MLWCLWVGPLRLGGVLVIAQAERVLHLHWHAFALLLLPHLLPAHKCCTHSHAPHQCVLISAFTDGVSKCLSRRCPSIHGSSSLCSLEVLVGEDSVLLSLSTIRYQPILSRASQQPGSRGPCQGWYCKSSQLHLCTVCLSHSRQRTCKLFDSSLAIHYYARKKQS